MASDHGAGHAPGCEAVDAIDQRSDQVGQENRQHENHKRAAGEVNEGDDQYEQKRGPHRAQDAPVELQHGY